MGCHSTTTPPPTTSAGKAPSLEALQSAAGRFGAVLTLPEFETTTNALHASVTSTMAEANAALDRVGRLQPGEVNFRNTIQALDDISYAAETLGNRLSLIKETHPALAMREAATEAVKSFQEWAVGLDYREDVHTAVKALRGIGAPESDVEVHVSLTGS